MLEAIVTVTFVEADDEGNAYPCTKVQRVEFEGDSVTDADGFLAYVQYYYRSVHTEQLVAVRRPMTFNHQVLESQAQLNALVDKAAADDKLLVQEGPTALIIDNDEATSATIYVVGE